MNKKTLVINKKGNVLDWFVIISFLFIISITIIVSFMLTSKVDESGVFSTDANAQNAVNKSKAAILSFDNLFMFIIIGLSLFVLISSAIVYNHPALFIVSLFLLAIAITIAGVISNAFYTFRTGATIAATANSFPKVIFLMEKLPYYILFMGVLCAIAMFVSYRQNQ